MGTSCLFNGTSSYIDLGNPFLLHPEGPFTMSAWVKLGPGAATAGQQDIISKGTHSYQLQKKSGSAAFQATIFDSTTLNWKNAYTDPIITEQQWYLVSGVYDDSTMSIYVNGTGNVQTASVQRVNRSEDPVNIGRNSATLAAWFSGEMDEIRLCATDRSVDWIVLDYQTQKPLAPVVYLRRN
jgi:hypothetical protein